jgi:ribokinase
MGRVVVAGSINVDLVARSGRFPAPGETVPGSALDRHPGGKGANQAVAAARLGARTVLLGAVGDDPFGDEVLGFVAAAGVDVAGVARLEGLPTGAALIVVAAGENTIVVAPGANAAFAPGDLDLATFEPGDVVVTQLEIPVETAARALERGRGVGATTILNAAPAIPFAPETAALADVLVVNRIELAVLVGAAVDEDRVEAAAVAARARTDQVVVVTLGARGFVAIRDGPTIRGEGLPVTPVDPTGAGDCFVGALAARLAAGDGLDGALAYANVAASISVVRRGAGSSMPTAEEVEAPPANL